MKKVKLSEVCKVVSGSTPKREKAEYWGGAIPWVTPKEISRMASPYLWDSAEKITEKGFRSCSTAMLPAGSLLLSSRAPIGLLAINMVPVCTNQGFKSLIPSKEIDVEYLYYYLKKNVNSLQAKGNGATFKELSKPAVEDFQIVLPHIDDQKRIAHLLGKVDGLIAQRKQHLQQLDDLLNSVFLEMFSEYLKNEDSYQPITDVCDFIDYRGKTPPRIEAGVPLISAKCVRQGYFDIERLDFISEETYKSWMKRGFPKANDVLFTTEGATFGYTCRIPRDFKKFAVGQRLITLVCKNGFRPEVLEFILNDSHIQKKLSSRLSGSAALGIRSAELAKVLIPSPPFGSQDQFAVIVEKVESLKSCYQQSLTDLENLYGALSQQAFKGELDLSRVPLPPDSLSSCENKQDEVETPIKSDIPKGIKIKLESLNVLNEKATGLKDIVRAARASSLIDSNQFDIVKQAAAQLTACHSPIEQLKNMSGIASVMEQLESTIKPLNLSQYDSLAKTAELARSMASSISKSDLSWLDQQGNAALKYANAPFESMRSAMEKIESLNYLQADSIAKRAQSALDYSTIVPKLDMSISKAYLDAQKARLAPLADMYNDLSISKYTQHLDAAARIQNIIPDFTTWQQRLASDSLVNYFDTEEGCERPSFYAEDILDILSNTTEPLSFKSLIDQLNELGTVDFVGYETIKTILFDLLAENQITQAFDQKQQILLFSIVENGSEQ